jgi:hypothetical protein
MPPPGMPAALGLTIMLMAPRAPGVIAAAAAGG